MRKALGAIVVLALLLAPCAAAGSARRPDIVDDAGDARGGDRASDILSAWLAPERDGLRFHVRVAHATDETDYTDHIYWVVMTLEETGESLAAAVGYGGDGVLRGHLTSGSRAGGLDDPGSPFMRGVPFERGANGGTLRLRADHGEPATFSGLIPWGAADGREPGATIEEWLVGVSPYSRRAGTWTGAADTAEAEEPFVATIRGPFGTFGAEVFPILVPAWVIPAIVLACVGSGMAGGFALARLAARASAAAPVGRAVPVHTQDAPPGERFRVEPPRSR